MRLTPLLGLVSLCLSACAMPHQGTGQPSVPANDLAAQRDYAECHAQAAQRAAGAGGWASVAPVQAAIRDTATRNYMAECLKSRGY